MSPTLEILQKDDISHYYLPLLTGIASIGEKGTY
jgi:hypothetical protein